MRPLYPLDSGGDRDGTALDMILEIYGEVGGS